ncbi:DUF3102 domain-containing protein [Micromonospora provocatoris]
MNELTTRTPVIIAAEINSIRDQTYKMVLANSIEIGRRLVEAKELVAHGEWTKWLEESVDYSKSTANNFMKIFEQYGADQFSLFGSDAKSQALGNLSYTQAVAILGIPEADRETFVKENDVENMSTRELQKAVKEKQKLEKQLKESQEEIKKEQAKQKELIKKQEKLDQQLANQVDYQKLLQEQLDKELAKPKTKDNSNKLKEIEDELTKSRQEYEVLLQRNEELIGKLKEKPLDVPVIEYVEKIPALIEEELNELREKVAKQGTDSSSIKFKYHFDSIVTEFKELLTTLNSIEDIDAKEKYKSAVNGLINKMVENL